MRRVCVAKTQTVQGTRVPLRGAVGLECDAWEPGSASAASGPVDLVQAQHFTLVKSYRPELFVQPRRSSTGRRPGSPYRTRRRVASRATAHDRRAEERGPTASTTARQDRGDRVRARGRTSTSCSAAAQATGGRRRLRAASSRTFALPGWLPHLVARACAARPARRPRRERARPLAVEGRREDVLDRVGGDELERLPRLGRQLGRGRSRSRAAGSRASGRRAAPRATSRGCRRSAAPGRSA